MDCSKMKAALKFELKDYRGVAVGVYGFIYALILIETIILLSYDKEVSSGGLEMISLVGVFIISICPFKSYLKLFTVNGYSRKTLFQITVIGFGIIAVIFSLIDIINTLIFSRFINYFSTYYLLNPLFQSTGRGQYTFPLLTEQFLWQITAYFLVAMLGLLISILYYRMSKALKIVVSIGVPVLVLFILPLLDKNLWNFRVSNAIQIFIAFSLGYIKGNYNPFISMGTFLLLAAAITVLAWLLVRRARVKQ